MAWGIAWLHLDWCVLMECFLKWCVKILHHYFSKHISTKSWPYKSANRMPCIRQCVYSLFLVLRKINSSWRNCFAPARYVWSGHPNPEHSQNFPLPACVKPVVNSLSGTCFLIVQVDSRCLQMSCWNTITLNDTVTLGILPGYTRIPICFVRGKKIFPIFTVCVPNLNFNPLFWGLWHAHSHNFKKCVFSVQPI